MTRALSFWLMPLLIAGCATRPVPVEISGLEAFQAHCETLPPVLSDAMSLELFEAYQAAMALPTPEERDAAVRVNVLLPLTQRDQNNRACALYEQRRADGLLTLASRFNDGVRSNVPRETN